jgi:hypothetical protein
MLAAGCVESTWRIAPDSPGSRMWHDDARTRGWTDIDVWYWLYTYGDAEARVSSAGERKQFKAKGKYRVDNSGQLLVMRFDGAEERYRLVTGGWLYVLPDQDRHDAPPEVE